MKLKLSALAALTALSFAAQAHFGMVIPDKSFVADQKKSTVNLTIAFAHPFEGNGMTMAEPKAFYVVADGKKTDLKATLKKAKFLDKAAWKSSFAAKRPGVYQFVVEPAAYWEPAEDKFIVHYTKVVVPAYGEEEGWDEPVGAKTEIHALLRRLADEALRVLPERVRHFAPLVGVTYGRITIRNQKSKWGSCSAQGNLNFNCLLMDAPAEVQDYVVVHELCHRKELNHSPAFWAQVARVLPGYKEQEKWLKTEGQKLIRRMTGG